jgi:hypothetical protein
MEDKLAPALLIISDESHPCHGVLDDPHAGRVDPTGREVGHEQPPEWIIAYARNQRDLRSGAGRRVSSDGWCAARKWSLK